jgi:hypothetical protein
MKKIVFIIISFFFLKSAICQVIPFDKLSKISSQKELEKILNGFIIVYKKEDSISVELKYSKCFSKDTLTFGFYVNKIKKTGTLTCMFDKYRFYKDSNVFFKTHGYVKKESLGSKFNGYLERFTNKKKEDFEIFLQPRGEGKGYYYFIYFPLIIMR